MASFLRKLIRKIPFNVPVLAKWIFLVSLSLLAIWILWESVTLAVRGSNIVKKIGVAFVTGISIYLLAKVFFHRHHLSWPHRTKTR